MRKIDAGIYRIPYLPGARCKAAGKAGISSRLRLSPALADGAKRTDVVNMVYRRDVIGLRSNPARHFLCFATEFEEIAHVFRAARATL